MCSLYRLLLTLSIEKQKCCAANTLSVGVRGILSIVLALSGLSPPFSTLMLLTLIESHWVGPMVPLKVGAGAAGGKSCVPV